MSFIVLFSYKPQKKKLIFFSLTPPPPHPVSWHLLYIKLNLRRKPWCVEGQLNNFFRFTHSQIIQVHPGNNKVWLNPCSMIWVRLEFQWENWVINLSSSSGFRELSQFKKKITLPHSATPISLNKWKFVYSILRLTWCQFC